MAASSAKYRVSSALMKDFSPSEISRLKKHFMSLDRDGSGTIDANELQMMMKEIGENVTSSQIRSMMASGDIDGDGTIDFTEFLVGLRGGVGRGCGWCVGCWL